MCYTVSTLFVDYLAYAQNTTSRFLLHLSADVLAASILVTAGSQRVEILGEPRELFSFIHKTLECDIAEMRMNIPLVYYVTFNVLAWDFDL